MRKILRRLGGPDSISLNAWLLLAPISVFFTQEVVPEGYSEDYTYINGLMVGLIGHVVTGAVLFLARAWIFKRLSKPQPVLFLATLALAGAVRGLSVSYSMELLGVLEAADYPERVRSGIVLIVIWFGVAGLVSDARASYRRSQQSLLDSIEQQLELRTSGERLIQISRAEILDQIKTTLAQALKLGSKAGDIQAAVDDLVRPLSHRLAMDLDELSRKPKQPKRSIKIYPVLQTAFYKTAFNPLPVALMAVFGTITSRLWTLGPQALLISVSDLLVIAGGMWLAKRLKLSGFLAILAWILIGFSSAAVADLLVNPEPLSNPTALLYFSVNVLGPALLFALLAAYDLEADKNLELLKLSLSRLEWETQAMRQRLWLERKRLSRFVHSELQSRLRSFAIRFQFQGSDPSEADLRRLREECEAALVFDDEQKPLSEQLVQTIELWRGVVECEVLIPDELMEIIEQDPYASSAIAEVIREGITNAVRHGGASHVRVDCTLTGDIQTGHALKLAITDNGQQDLVDNSGLGMKMLSEVTSSNSLSRDSGITTLSAELPIRLST